MNGLQEALSVPWSTQQAATCSVGLLEVPHRGRSVRNDYVIGQVTGLLAGNVETLMSRDTYRVGGDSHIHVVLILNRFVAILFLLIRGRPLLDHTIMLSCLRTLLGSHERRVT